MQQLIEQKGNAPTAPFTDRRQHAAPRTGAVERRQFMDSRDSLKPEVAELANAIDQYKLRHRRRFITFEELHSVISELGYHK